MARELKTGSAGKAQQKPAGPPGPDPRFHAVEIRCGSGACAAALELKSKRFLSRQSPPILPLKDCDRPGSCTCRYVHHNDRRDDSRREADTGIWDMTKLDAAGNRRLGRGRRKDD
jgi:hypothetical protein